MNAPNFTDDAAHGVKIKLANHWRSLAWGDGKASFAALALLYGGNPLKESFLGPKSIAGCLPSPQCPQQFFKNDFASH